MKCYLLLILLTICSTQHPRAQPLQTIYYANGKKAVEGRWQYNVNNVLPTTYERAYSGNAPRAFRDVMTLAGSKEETWHNDWHLMTMKCEGLVTTWYYDGVKKSEITFVAGVPSGPYARYHPNGQLAMEGNLVAGMPHGRWKAFYANGQPYFTGYFQPFSQRELHYRWQNQAINGDYSSPIFTREPQWEDEESIDSAEVNEAYYSGGDRIGFATYDVRSAFRNFSIRAISKKDGVFIFYREDGAKHAEVAFRNNKRNGTWKLWNDGPAPSLVLEYDMGRLSYVSDSNGRRTPAAYAAWWRAEMAHRQGGVVEAPVASTIFKHVEQAPHFDGNIVEYVVKEMKLSKKVQRKSYGRNVTVEFYVDEYGQVIDPIITESANPDFDRELLRVFKEMPRWRPGKLQGRAVRTRYKVGFYYGLQYRFESKM